MAKPKVGVWWDINTCPVPDHIEPRSVRLRIESEMKKHIKTPFEVVVTCFGNLDYISPEILHDLTRSGINLAHAIFGIHDVLRFVDVDMWSKKTETPLSNTIVMISDRYWWLKPSDLGWRGTLLRCVHDLLVEPGQLFWDAVLDNNPVAVDEPNKLSDDVASFVCYLCRYNSDDFIKHLQSNEHKEKTFDSSWRRDDNGKFVHFCEVCNYAGYDEDNMDIHYDSNYHKDKVSSMNLVDQMELPEKDPQEENCKEELEASRKRTGNELLNEANKKR